MNLQLIRYSLSSQSTLGLLLVDGNFACYTLEDANRATKIPGETCIPAGKYKIGLRTEGGQNHRYSQKFPEMHKGMLHLQNVPNFQYIHIHIGNTKKDTDGCILVGDGSNNNLVSNGMISSSTNAYQRIYPVISEAIVSGEEVWINITDGVPTGKDAEPMTKALVSADRLNLRIAPNSEVEGVLTEGTAANIVKSKNGWCKVQVEGWVAEEYLVEG
jgi:hypothetical protein